jgi:ABC-type antimicrobial peptide transport system permease subunit
VPAIALFVVVAAVRAVMRVSVERSAAEIGLRMAVGATPTKIKTLVIRRSLNRLAWGTVMGIFVGLVFLGQLQRVIPEISPPPMEWVLVWTSFLSLVAVWGAWGPAGHAARQDPARVLSRG